MRQAQYIHIEILKELNYNFKVAGFNLDVRFSSYLLNYINCFRCHKLSEEFFVQINGHQKKKN